MGLDRDFDLVVRYGTISARSTNGTTFETTEAAERGFVPSAVRF
jgi:hypothetical protein